MTASRPGSKGGGGLCAPCHAAVTVKKVRSISWDVARARTRPPKWGQPARVRSGVTGDEGALHCLHGEER